MSCCPHPTDCCYYPSCGPCAPCAPCTPCTPYQDYCAIRRNRSCCDYLPKRLSPLTPVSPEKKKPKSPKKDAMAGASCKKSPANPKRSCPKSCPRKMEEDELEESTCKMPQMCSLTMPKCKSTCDPKQTKNKQNFQYQDLKKRMEVINEECEAEGSCDTDDSKKIQDSCADFLNIVHDTVLETVQSSVESILRNYYLHTMERIETLCSQMMRNECLLSKMYLDLLDKLSQQSDKGMRQFKCICQFLADFDNSSRERKSNTQCTCSTEEAVMCAAKKRASAMSGSRCRNRSRNGRDSDTEPRTDDGSMTSCCALPKLQAKSKSREVPSSNTSVMEEGSRSNHRRRSGGEYTEVRQRAGADTMSCHQGNDIIRPSDSYRILKSYSMTDGRHVNVRHRNSEAEMPRISR